MVLELELEGAGLRRGDQERAVRQDTQPEAEVNSTPNRLLLMELEGWSSENFIHLP